MIGGFVRAVLDILFSVNFVYGTYVAHPSNALILPQDAAEAVELLDGLPACELTSASWQHVAAILSVMDAAIESRDAGSFTTSVGDLEVVATRPPPWTRHAVTGPPASVTVSAALLARALRQMSHT